MAQYYHIYNWEEYEVRYIATLACGLPSESRTQMALHGQALNPLMSFMVTLIDQQNLILWQNGGCKGSKPESVTTQLKRTQENESMPRFSYGIDFLVYRKKYVKGHEHNGE